MSFLDLFKLEQEPPNHKQRRRKQAITGRIKARIVIDRDVRNNKTKKDFVKGNFKKQKATRIWRNERDVQNNQTNLKDNVAKQKKRKKANEQLKGTSKTSKKECFLKGDFTQSKKWKEEFETIVFYPTTTRTFDERTVKMQRKDVFPRWKAKLGGNKEEEENK